MTTSTTIITSAMALALAAGCSKDSNPGAPEPPEPAPAETETEEEPVETNSDVDLDWTMSRAGDALRIEYRLTNRTEGDIFVADQLIAYHAGAVKRAPERVIVTAGSGPGVVRFVRGLVEADTEEMDHPPGAERLAPNATRTGSATVPLPLRGWHNYSTPPDIPDDPRTAELEIAYLVGDSIEWGKVKSSDGAEITVPQMPSYLRFARTVRTTPRPIP